MMKIITHCTVCDKVVVNEITDVANTICKDCKREKELDEGVDGFEEDEPA